MNFIELTYEVWDGITHPDDIKRYITTKQVINFNFVKIFKPALLDKPNGPSIIMFNTTHDNLWVEESAQQIEKLLNETGHYIKRAYKSEL